jgi:glycosyltransferase involved in cell wall biosynthesis
MKLVSILIPAFNAEKGIGDAIRSAVSQTWPRKEIVVVDDGSRDGTLAVARRFASTPVSVMTQVNQGAAAARNRALSVWLDADDLLAPHKVVRQMHEVMAQSGHASFPVFGLSVTRAVRFEPPSLRRRSSATCHHGSGWSENGHSACLAVRGGS